MAKTNLKRCKCGSLAEVITMGLGKDKSYCIRCSEDSWVPGKHIEPTEWSKDMKALRKEWNGRGEGC